jgi:hypothetical protein
VLADAARAAIRSASPNRFRASNPGRRRRRDHHDVDKLVGDRAVDEPELEGRLDGAKDELLLAHRPGLFVKTRSRVGGRRLAVRHVLARLAWFPPAATSNRACGFPAHGSPTFFTVSIRLPDAKADSVVARRRFR